MNQGISILQGPHQVAQKLSRTTFPLKSESFTVFPVASLSSKSGAALRSFSAVTAARTLLPVQPPKKAAQPRTRSALAHHIFILTLIISGSLAMQEMPIQTNRGAGGENAG